MKSVYETATSVDAHMILNLLQQEGIEGRVDGEYLQGGVGDLQAINLVRVLVPDENLVMAREIINKWEALEPRSPKEENKIEKKSNGLLKYLVGVLVGIAGMYWAYNTPVTIDGIDFNGDGSLDEKWTYVNGRISKTELDRNLDRKVDYRYFFNRKGIVSSSESDENFDGIFETESKFKNGIIILSKSDTREDGYKNYHVLFKNGALDKTIFHDSKTKKPLKVQKFNGITLISSEIDTNNDGSLDAVYEYDEIEEIVK